LQNPAFGFLVGLSYRKLSLVGGEVILPAGLKNQQLPSDTLQGQLRSGGGKFTVHYDIGFYAGAYASQRGSSEFQERVVDGARVWIAQRADRGRYAVSFPDNGCPNFYLDSHNPAEVQLIARIATSFHPRVTHKSECGAR
jgi:hypothetical protein